MTAARSTGQRGPRAEVPRRGSGVRLGRRALAERAVARHDHLRAAREGLHAAASRGARAPAGQVPRARGARGPRSPERLGVTTVELMPCQAFASGEIPDRQRSGELLGLQPARLVRARCPLRGRRPGPASSRPWCARCTARDSKSILDVVFNHTAEGNEGGPDAEPAGLRQLRCITGSSRTTSPVTRTSPAAATRSGSTTPDVRVAGARLPALLGHGDARGRLPLRPRAGRGSRQQRLQRRARRSSRRCASDPALAYVKFIAEPWDVGPAATSSATSRRDGRSGTTVTATPCARSGAATAGCSARSPSAIAGSSDLFRQHGRKPTASVNFVAAHDGFTLADSVVLQRTSQRGQPRGRRRRPRAQPELELRRRRPDGRSGRASRCASRQVANLLATLFLSQGVPMLLAGDEFGQTQRGNNNAYCQDNEISWLDWSLPETKCGTLFAS